MNYLYACGQPQDFSNKKKLKANLYRSNIHSNIHGNMKSNERNKNFFEGEKKKEEIQLHSSNNARFYKSVGSRIFRACVGLVVRREGFYFSR